MLKFCIIDDNLSALNKLSSMLDTIFIRNDFDAEVSFKTTDVHSLMSFVSSNKCDVLIMDIDLQSDIDGMKLANEVRKNDKNCYFIFISAHLEFGFLAYKYKTFDYLPKPLSTKSLEKTIIRLFDDIKDSHRKFIRLDNKNTIIDEDEVEYIKRDGMKIVFHTEFRDYEVYSSFIKLQDKLSDNFVRCHKSFIANMNNVTRVEPLSNLIYFNDSTCDIGPKYKNKFMEVINNYGNIK